MADLDKSQDDEPMIETCRVITLYEEEIWDDINDEDEVELYYLDEDHSLPEQLYN